MGRAEPRGLPTGGPAARSGHVAHGQGGVFGSSAA
jgi:hypothetical protein